MPVAPPTLAAHAAPAQWLALQARMCQEVLLGVLRGNGRDMQVHEWGHLAGHTDELTALHFSPVDPMLLASASYRDPVYLWNIAECAAIRQLGGHPSDVIGLAFSWDGWLLAVALTDGTIWVWTQEGDLVDRISNNKAGRVSIAFSPISHRLAIIDEDGQIYLWDLVPARLLYTFSSVLLADRRPEGISPGYYSLAFSPDGRYLAVDVHSLRGSIQFWQISESWSGAQWLGALGHRVGADYDLAFAPHDRLLAISGDTGIQLVDLLSPSSTRKLALLDDTAYKMAFSPNGLMLAVGSSRGNVYIWDIKKEKIIANFKAHSETISWAINSIDWSPNGKILATGGWEIQAEYRTKHSHSKKQDSKNFTSFPIKLWEIR